MTNSESPVAIVEALLKSPGKLIHELERNWRASVVTWLLIFAAFGMALYGAVVGTFCGGAQIWIAPAKLALGTVAAALICLPSLYIFSCLGGIDARLRMVAGVLFAAVALTALLLIGFAPVAWIFSQSTDSVAFMGRAPHFPLAHRDQLRATTIAAANRWLAGTHRSHMKVWSCMFLVVCLQMMTTLRPIVGKSDRFLPAEKKFFLAHWYDTLAGNQSH